MFYENRQGLLWGDFISYHKDDSVCYKLEKLTHKLIDIHTS